MSRNPADKQTSESTRMEFAVEMKSSACVEKVKKAVGNLSGLKIVDVNLHTQRLIVEGDAIAKIVSDNVEKETGLSTVLLGQGTEKQNFGAAVAAISIGNSGVQGLLRFVQSSPETCVIEGTLDKVPSSAEPVFLAVHESGDVTSECNSCGSVLKVSNDFNGILSQLDAGDNMRAEFRTSVQNIKLSDMIGHCVVVHQGHQADIEQNKSKRLACGIIARASGLFENSKRFCTCDGISIWDQRQLEKQGKL